MSLFRIVRLYSGRAYAVPRTDFRNPKNLEAGKREAEATPKQQRDLYDVEKFEKVSATQKSVNPLESNKC